MEHHVKQLQQQLKAANQQEPSETVITNGKIVDVINHEIIEQDLAIEDGKIVGIGKYNGRQVIDAEGQYIVPGLIDGHVHIESSMVTPNEFSRAVVPHGVTTIITDPHEIANVLGVDGVNYMLDKSEDIPLDVFFMLPSSVPATPFENNGATINAEDLKPLLQHPRVLGLAEVMDFPAVASGSEAMLNKIAETKKHSPLVDGHGAGLDENGVNVYGTAGVRTDHECVTASEAKDRLRRGMYLMLREGSGAKDLRNLISVITPQNAHRCLFCTDDKHLDELVADGSIDHNVRLAIHTGMDPFTAIQMATINAANCFNLEDKGLIAPGKDADFMLVDDLETLAINEVYKDGICVSNTNDILLQEKMVTNTSVDAKGSVNCPVITEQDLKIPFQEDAAANIIEIIPNSLITRHLVESVPVENDTFVASTEHDYLKMAVIERHKNTGNVGLGIVKGFGLKSGAIATTIAHDSHNIVALGTNDSDMVLAVQTLKTIQGGLVIVKDGSVIQEIALPVAGLMTDKPCEEMVKNLDNLHTALFEIGASSDFNPFLTLSFLSLPVIPDLKLTDKGLFNVNRFEHIDIVHKKATSNRT